MLLPWLLLLWILLMMTKLLLLLLLLLKLLLLANCGRYGAATAPGGPWNVLPAGGAVCGVADDAGPHGPAGLGR